MMTVRHFLTYLLILLSLQVFAASDSVNSSANSSITYRCLGRNKNSELLTLNIVFSVWDDNDGFKSQVLTFDELKQVVVLSGESKLNCTERADGATYLTALNSFALLHKESKTQLNDATVTIKGKCNEEFDYDITAQCYLK
jgi:hypothetical protein